MPAQLQDHFTLGLPLGRNAAGAVWQAEDKRDESTVAIAMVDLEEVKDKALGRRLSTRFRRDLELLKKVKHPNVTRVHEVGRDADGRPYAAMEFVDGENLDDWLATPRTGAERIEIANGLLQGLEAAHRVGVTHGDLEPGNILVTDEGTPKVIGFGLNRALARQAEPGWEKNSGVVRSLSYRAPEQARGSGGTRTDIFALGLILHRVLLDRLPHEEGGSAGLPTPIGAVLRKALAEDAAERHVSVWAMRKAWSDAVTESEDAIASTKGIFDSTPSAGSADGDQPSIVVDEALSDPVEKGPKGADSKDTAKDDNASTAKDDKDDKDSKDDQAAATAGNDEADKAQSKDTDTLDKAPAKSDKDKSQEAKDSNRADDGDSDSKPLQATAPPKLAKSPPKLAKAPPKRAKAGPPKLEPKTPPAITGADVDSVPPVGAGVAVPDDDDEPTVAAGVVVPPAEPRPQRGDPTLSGIGAPATHDPDDDLRAIASDSINPRNRPPSLPPPKRGDSDSAELSDDDLENGRLSDPGMRISLTDVMVEPATKTPKSTPPPPKPAVEPIDVSPPKPAVEPIDVSPPKPAKPAEAIEEATIPPVALGASPAALGKTPEEPPKSFPWPMVLVAVALLSVGYFVWKSGDTPPEPIASEPDTIGAPGTEPNLATTEPDPTAETETVPTTPVAEPPEPEVGEPVQLTLHGLVEGASITIDGLPTVANSDLAVLFPNDGRQHVLEVRSAGNLPWQRTLATDEALDLLIVAEPDPNAVVPEEPVEVEPVEPVAEMTQVSPMTTSGMTTMSSTTRMTTRMSMRGISSMGRPTITTNPGF